MRSQYRLMYIIGHVTQCYDHHILIACISNRLLSQQNILSTQRSSGYKISFTTQLTFNQNLFECRQVQITAQSKKERAIIHITFHEHETGNKENKERPSNGDSCRLVVPSLSRFSREIILDLRVIRLCGRRALLISVALFFACFFFFCRGLDQNFSYAF